MKKELFLLMSCVFLLCTFGSTSAQISIGDTLTFGFYEQDNDLSNGTEAIEWQVLSVESGSALLISCYGLDTKPYHPEFVDITWEESAIRQWLNNEFYESAFSPNEKQQILITKLSTPGNPQTGAPGGNDTEDKVFLLSIPEAEMYFSTDSERQTIPTDYARALGAQIEDGYGRWWTRTPGGGNFQASIVLPDGRIGMMGDFTEESKFIVKPAIRIKVIDKQQGPQIYTAAEGDTCESIVSSFGVDYDFFMMINSMMGGCSITPGQTLLIPAQDQHFPKETEVPTATAVTLAATQIATPESDTNYITGLDAYQKQKYELALPYLKASAEAGNSDAQYLVGQLYDFGRGVEKSYETAAEYYRLASDQGDARAQFSLGYFYNYYDFGQDMKTTYEIAAHYYQLSADQGHDDSQYRLGMLYYYGNGVSQSYEQAAHYFSLSADKGNSNAQYMMGWLYDQGQGVKQSYETAAEYYRLASDQGDARAQFSLGWFYSYYQFGQDMNTTMEMAAHYFQLSADQGHAESQYRLGELYYNGSGVAQSYDMAMKYFQLAADQNFELAVNRIKELRK